MKSFGLTSDSIYSCSLVLLHPYFVKVIVAIVCTGSPGLWTYSCVIVYIVCINFNLQDLAAAEFFVKMNKPPKYGKYILLYLIHINMHVVAVDLL